MNRRESLIAMGLALGTATGFLPSRELFAGTGKTTEFKIPRTERKILDSLVQKIEDVVSSPNEKSSFNLGGPGLIPDGHSELCIEDPEHPWCKEIKSGKLLEINNVEQLRKFLDTINSINLYINKNFKPVSDLEQHNVSDKWAKSNYLFKGDCEEYAKTKYHFLTRTIDKDYRIPPEAVRPTYVFNRHLKEGHLNLSVTFKYKDKIVDLTLDNLTDSLETIKEASDRLVFYSRLGYDGKWEKLV